MSPVNKHICELLYDHDCVIVPQLGGFLVSYAGARLHPVHHTIAPPSRKVAFNVFLKQNDGLLANNLSSFEGISYAEAIQKIESYVATCHRALSEGRKLVIDQVGELFYDKEQNLQFEPFSSVNYLRDSFGLSTLQYLPVAHEGQNAEKQLRDFVTIRPSVKPQQKKTVSGRRKISGVAGALMVAAAVVWMGVNIFLVLKDNKQTISEVNKTEQVEAHSSQATVQPPVSIESTASVITVPAVAENEADSEPIPQSPPAVIQQQPIQQVITPQPASSITTAKKYFIIAGAFRIASNADGLVSDLQKQGFMNARIISSQHELTLVCYDGFTSKTEALSILDTLRQGKRDGWIFSN